MDELVIVQRMFLPILKTMKISFTQFGYLQGCNGNFPTSAIDVELRVFLIDDVVGDLFRSPCRSGFCGVVVKDHAICIVAS